MERKALGVGARSADAATAISSACQAFKDAIRLKFALHHEPSHEGWKGYKLIPSAEIWVQVSARGGVRQSPLSSGGIRSTSTMLFTPLCPQCRVELLTKPNR